MNEFNEVFLKKHICFLTDKDLCLVFRIQSSGTLNTKEKRTALPLWRKLPIFCFHVINNRSKIKRYDDEQNVWSSGLIWKYVWSGMKSNGCLRSINTKVSPPERSVQANKPQGAPTVFAEEMEFCWQINSFEVLYKKRNQFFLEVTQRNPHPPYISHSLHRPRNSIRQQILVINGPGGTS